MFPLYTGVTYTYNSLWLSLHHVSMSINIMVIGKHTVAVASVIQHDFTRVILLLPFSSSEMLMESKELFLTVMSIITQQEMLMVQAVIRMKFHVVVVELCFLFDFYVV